MTTINLDDKSSAFNGPLFSFVIFFLKLLCLYNLTELNKLLNVSATVQMDCK